MQAQRRQWRRCWSDTSNLHHEVIGLVLQLEIENRSSAAMGLPDPGVAAVNGPRIGIKASTMAHRGFQVVEELLRRLILKEFFKIQLSQLEAETAAKALRAKYVPAVWSALLYGALLLPAVFILDTSIVVSVLIPTTMVAGTAWYAVSLASMKKKFESFGLELTTDLFVAFALSLTMLFLATTASVARTAGVELPWSVTWRWLRYGAGILALGAVGKLLFAIFAGSIKYDINDAMLTGQNEAAERYFKTSLSLLHTTAQALRSSRSLQVANYSIGLAFYEVFSKCKGLYGGGFRGGHLEEWMAVANRLIRSPAMGKKDADALALQLVNAFVQACCQSAAVTGHKSYIAVMDEITCLTDNEDEEQAMTDTRMAIVFTEISNLLEEFGMNLFEPSSL